MIFNLVVDKHCVNSARIWSFSGPCFPAIKLNTERYSVFSNIQPEYEKIRSRKSPNTDTFDAVLIARIWRTEVRQNYKDRSQLPDMAYSNEFDHQILHYNKLEVYYNLLTSWFKLFKVKTKRRWSIVWYTCILEVRDSVHYPSFLSLSLAEFIS